MSANDPIVTDIAVVPFETRHAPVFRALNIAWVERYFGTVEDKDYYLLDDPQGRIINKGGVVLIAEDQSGHGVGCVALVAGDDNELELAKMAVADEYQGRGVGRMLMEAAIAKGRDLGARALYLESNSSLKPALTLYEKAGFQHLPAEERPQSPYMRCDVYMRLEF
ncbi:MAG TPA: GNAT family N-acetyltransferase [Allosphingosinicella sp.]|nr:GNAT family N-acetyltransferase [Allosphingosinicella sp.]